MASIIFFRCLLLIRFFNKLDGPEPAPCLLICGAKQEYRLGEQILKLTDVPLQNLCGLTTLVELAGLLSQSRLTISNDTGVVYLSSAVGTSSVCIVGGGHFGRFVPYPDFPGQSNHLKTVYYSMPCYGCNW